MCVHCSCATHKYLMEFLEPLCQYTLANVKYKLSCTVRYKAFSQLLHSNKILFLTVKTYLSNMKSWKQYKQCTAYFWKYSFIYCFIHKHQVPFMFINSDDTDFHNLSIQRVKLHMLQPGQSEVYCEAICVWLAMQSVFHVYNAMTNCLAVSKVCL